MHSRSPAQSGNADLTNRNCGTLGYIAPEVCSGGSYSYAADVFSVGAVIYEMLHNKVCVLIPRSCVPSSHTVQLPFGIRREYREYHAVVEAMATQPVGVDVDIDGDAHDLLLTVSICEQFVESRQLTRCAT